MSPIPDEIIPKDRELSPEMAQIERKMALSNQYLEACREYDEVRRRHVRHEASDDELAAALKKADEVWAMLEEATR
jgi:hypothetical protein